MSSTTRVILSLAPDMLSAALVRRGRILQAEAIELDASQWNELWSGGMMRLDQPLRQLMSRFPARARRSAILLYHSPTMTKQVYSFDLPSGAAKAAAVAKIRESIGFRDPVEASTLTKHLRDAKQTTVLAFSEREEPLRAIYAWLNRCGVEVETMVPSSAAVMKAATSIASTVEPETAVFYMDSDVSVMVYASEGELKLIRPADIGYRKLTEAYLQAFPGGQPGPDEPRGELSRRAIEHNARATAMLFEHGIPMQTREVDGKDLRSGVFPFLAPVLQRICIDIKQTMRFGLGNTPQPKSLMICGPGACISGLNKAIAQHVDVQIKTENGAEAYMPNTAFGRGTLEWYLIDSRATFTGLMPEIARDAKVRSRLNSALMTGAAVAALALGGEFVYSTVQLQRLDRLEASIKPRIESVNRFQNRCATAGEVSSAISDVASLVTASVAKAPQWEFPLARLGDLTGDSIRIQELRGEYTADAASIEINGLAIADSDRGTGKALDEFVASVERLDAVGSVSLGATSRVSVGDQQWGRQFRMKVMINQPPPPYAAYITPKADEFTRSMP